MKIAKRTSPDRYFLYYELILKKFNSIISKKEEEELHEMSDMSSSL